jgi:hypothetical protein
VQSVPRLLQAVSEEAPPSRRNSANQECQLKANACHAAVLQREVWVDTDERCRLLQLRTQYMQARCTTVRAAVHAGQVYNSACSSTCRPGVQQFVQQYMQARCTTVRAAVHAGQVYNSACSSTCRPGVQQYVQQYMQARCTTVRAAVHAGQVYSSACSSACGMRSACSNICSRCCC